MNLKNRSVMELITQCWEENNNPENVIKYIDSSELDEKAIVLRYLKSKKSDGIACHTMFDYIKNKSIGTSVFSFSDGKYMWDSEDIYYFENYNLKLKKEFVDYVINEKNKAPNDKT